MNKEINKILIAGTEYDIRDSRFDEASQAETARQEAEQGRVTAEQQRADAEAARAEEFATFEGRIAAKEDAANKVTSIGADANNTTFPTTRAVLNSIAEVKNVEVTPEMLSESTKQYINASGGGTITNLADDEDLTSVDNVLKLADKDYSPTSYSGMGRVYLRKNIVDSKNILTQEMMAKENTIYIIQYDYDLNGATINVPANCTLDFQGGSLANGTLSGTHTIICAPNYMIFALTLKLAGSFDSCARPEWYGTYPNIKSVCLADSCNRLYEAFDTIVLNVGKYYLYSGNSINVKNLNGVNKDSNIWVSNIYEGYCPLILGKVGGTSNERLWGKTISNISVYIQGENIHQTSCLTVGATTRCFISNVIFWNYSARIAEYTEEEFADPISNSSYAIVFDGSTELLKISGFTFSADIPMLFKSGCDFLTVSEGYCEVKQYGFGGIYMGKTIGSNCTFENFDIAQGIYPIYIHNKTIQNGYCNFVNLRFEQVRKPDFISDVACNIYIDGEVYIDKVVFSKIVFSSNTNGLLFKGSANIFMDNTGNYFDKAKNNYYLKIEGDNIKIKAINCEAGFNTGVQIPDGYVKDGLCSSVLYGNTFNTTKFGYITQIYKTKTVLTGFSSPFFSDGSYKYIKHEEKHYTKDYNLLLSFKDVENFQLIKCVVIDIEIFDNDNYAKASVLFKFSKGEDGNKTNVIDDYYIISSIGDDVFSKTIQSGKFAIIAKGQSYIEVYNRVSTDLYANVDINLFTSSIL